MNGNKSKFSIFRPLLLLPITILFIAQSIINLYILPPLFGDAVSNAGLFVLLTDERIYAFLVFYPLIFAFGLGDYWLYIKTSRKRKIIACVLVLLPFLLIPVLYPFALAGRKATQIESQKKAQELNEKLKPIEEANERCDNEFKDLMNSHSIITSDKLVSEGDYKSYNYVIEKDRGVRYRFESDQNLQKAKIYIPTEFDIFIEPPRGCYSPSYYLGFWDKSHNLYIQEDTDGKRFNLFDKNDVLLEELLKAKPGESNYTILDKLQKIKKNGITIYASKELKVPYYVITSMIWSPEAKGQWNYEKRFVYSIVNGEINQKLAEKIIESASKISINK